MLKPNHPPLKPKPVVLHPVLLLLQREDMVGTAARQVRLARRRRKRPLPHPKVGTRQQQQMLPLKK